ncbi:g4654 [Coccomyxa viridis]|uniref:Maltase n=1 Tax=Coccomyxa viridis TaxID=1274662 RepID=A0ABP1FQT8_9CHLO
MSPLNVLVEPIDSNILHLKISAPGRWEVPQREIFINTGVGRVPGQPTYSLNYSAAPFEFTLSRLTATASVAPLFDTGRSCLIFKDQYMEISTAIPASATLFGLGEHTSTDGFALRRDGVPYALWTRDQTASTPNVGLYGAHPFYMDVREDGQTHGVMLLNSNGMDVVVTETKLQYRVIGGVLDFYFFLGPTPLKVIGQLTSIIGRPYMPPYWGLGLMQSKADYVTLQYAKSVVEKYAEAGIPLEFPIVNTQMHIRRGYAPYDLGVQKDVFIKDVTGSPYVGQLWAGAAHYPDFLAHEAQSWWKDQIDTFSTMLPVDGIWLDMNEPDNFCSCDVAYDPGRVECKRGLAEVAGLTNGVPLPPAGIFNPPFAINVGLNQQSILTKTIALSAHHLDGTLEYNVHNLYGHNSAMATWRALGSIYPNKRPFLLTRSTFLGTGAYGAHWTGDTQSSWQDLQWSIGDMFTNGIAGIAYVGADICGFMGTATEELCARWAAAAAWQPFARNHHADGFQEFYLHPRIEALTKKAYDWRLRAVPYHYTAFYDAHTSGCSVMRPLFFSWPLDTKSLLIDRQWMLGDAIMVAPILLEGTNTTQAYFPAGRWYDLYNHSSIDTSNAAQHLPVVAGLEDNPPVYVRGGNIVPLGASGLMTTTALRASNLTLLAAFPSAESPHFERCGQGCRAQSTAQRLVTCGHMYLDQGEDRSVGHAQDNYLGFEAHHDTDAGSGSLFIYWPNAPGGRPGCFANTSWPVLDAITILGLPPINASSVSVLVGNPPSASLSPQ